MNEIVCPYCGYEFLCDIDTFQIFFEKCFDDDSFEPDIITELNFLNMLRVNKTIMYDENKVTCKEKSCTTH